MIKVATNIYQCLIASMLTLPFFFSETAMQREEQGQDNTFGWSVTRADQ
jgi:hypothetical protein